MSTAAADAAAGERSTSAVAATWASSGSSAARGERRASASAAESSAGYSADKGEGVLERAEGAGRARRRRGRRRKRSALSEGGAPAAMAGEGGVRLAGGWERAGS